jgi:hypothetical protein
MVLGWKNRTAIALFIAPVALAIFAAAVPSLAQEATGGKETVTSSPADPAADGEDALPVPPPSWQAASSPQLACGVRPGGSRATFTCWVAGAPPGDTAFTVQLLRLVDEMGNTRPIGTICGAGQLVDGTGACSGTATDPSGPLFGGVLVLATLQPSGTQVGPIQIAPTLAGA